MNENMNRKMADRLEQRHDFIQSHPLEEKLRHLIDAPLLEIDGCFFFEEEWKRSRASLSQFPDRTGLECFVNHVHMEDFVKRTKRTSAHLIVDLLFAQGWQCATHLKERLAAYRPEVGFRIIITADEGTYPSCTVRFHLIRKHENWLANDLEGYREEAVGFLDTRES